MTRLSKDSINQQNRTRKGRSSRTIKSIRPGLVLMLAAIIALLTLAAAGSPVRASSIPPLIRPGYYAGTVSFTLSHAYTLTSDIFPVNDYSLVAEGNGTIRFIVSSDGKFQSIALNIPGFVYLVTGHMVIKTDDPCKGFSTFGGGEGTIQLSAPPLVTNKIVSPAVRLSPGEPWGDVYEVGDCSGLTNRATFITSIKDDFNMVPPGPWEFTMTPQPHGRLAGTCTTALWQTADRSMSCYWQVFRIK